MARRRSKRPREGDDATPTSIADDETDVSVSASPAKKSKVTLCTSETETSINSESLTFPAVVGSTISHGDAAATSTQEHLLLLQQQQQQRGGQEMKDGGAHHHSVGERTSAAKGSFCIFLNERPTRVPRWAPFVNLRAVLGRAGVLLQDITQPAFPVLLMPCPHSGNVRVRPRRRYRLVKFVGEHLCLAGDFAPDHSTPHVFDVNENDILEQRRRETWAMSELLGMMVFLSKHPDKTADDFLALPPEEAGRYHTKGNAALLTDDEDDEKRIKKRKNKKRVTHCDKDCDNNEEE